VNRSTGSTYVLGTGLSHDGSACLLKDGRIHVAIEKERLTRIKHDGYNDTAAITYCLDAAGITLDDVTLIVQNANFGMLERGHTWWSGERLVPADAPIVTISHHLAHAYSAIGTCPFDETAVLVIDGCGSAYDECLDRDGAIIPEVPDAPEFQQLLFEKDSYYHFGGGRLTTIYKDFSPWGIGNRRYPMCPNTTRHSLGGVYEAASMYAFHGFEDAGKLMGLAPYGRPGTYDFDIFELRDGRAFVRYDWMKDFTRPARSPEDFNANFSYYADIAYWVQQELERAVQYIVRSRFERAPCENLAYAGGVALNAVANARILRESPFKRVYFQPAAQDNGLAIGCAYYGWMQVLERERPRHDGSTCFGRGYDRASVKTMLESHSDVVEAIETPDYIDATAEALADGKVIAWFQAGAEFGPRALGHRSILADPRRAEVRQFINAAIKRREDFRPFAPSVPAEEASRYFDCTYESPYMILVASVRPEWASAIPSVVHRNGSARLHTVTAESDPAFHALLRRFGARTGIPVLLNTSLNKRRMPIVETPEQALRFFLACPLDLLVIEGCIVLKRPTPSPVPWDLERFFTGELQEALNRNASAAARIGGIYQVRVASTRAWTIDLSTERPRIFESTPSDPADLIVTVAEADLRCMIADPVTEGRRLFDAHRIQAEGDHRRLSDVARLFELRSSVSASLSAQ